MPAAGLLVRQEEQHDVTAGPDAPLLPLLHDGEDHRVHVLHVHRPAAPHHAVVDRSFERRDGPVGCDGRHDIEVQVDGQRVRVGVLTRYAAHDDLPLR